MRSICQFQCGTGAIVVVESPVTAAHIPGIPGAADHDLGGGKDLDEELIVEVVAPVTLAHVGK